VADDLEVGRRTVWRWVAVAPKAGAAGRRRASEFAVTDEDITELAYWNGNVSALYRVEWNKPPLGTRKVPRSRLRISRYSRSI
jgi:hypothetical protein